MSDELDERRPAPASTRIPRRVAITGMGIICSLGHNPGEFWRSLAAGQSGIRPITLVDRATLRMQCGAEVTGYRWEDHFLPKRESMLDRFAQWALISARQAVAASGIEWNDDLRRRTAIITGSCVGGQKTVDEGFVALYKNGKPRVNPMTIPRTMANAGASQISMEFGVTGPAWTISTACSSSNHAIGQAYWMVRNGTCEMAITGGSEAPFHYGFLKSWDAIRVVAVDICRPFSKDRQGMILGEGGAMLVLEPLERAVARGAAVLAEIIGFGMSSDAHHLTQPSSDGAAAAMTMALADGGLRPEQIGYINAHGTGTTANDPAESRAIHAVFGAHADKLLVSSTKSMHGHTLGAAGALEAVATVLALTYGLIPPTANFTEPDPECLLDVVPNVARPAKVEYALSNSFAFGGLNAVLALRGPNGL
jgi:nodulation protein E